MVQHQIHFGRKFYQDKKTGYWISTDSPRIRAHQWIWIKSHSIIPNGYHIHHINEDKSDNRIENLELIHKSRHISHHMKDPERIRKASENCDRIRHLTKAWHASEEGREWHRKHAKKCNFGNGPSIKYHCQSCSKEYESKLKAIGRSRFCSNKCKSKWRRDHKLDYIEKVCPVCSKSYQTSIYSKSKTCGRECGRISRKNTLRK